MTPGIDPLSHDTDAAYFQRPDLVADILGGPQAARLAAVAGDFALLVDGDGVVRDAAFSDAALAAQVAPQLLNRPWVETVREESRGKVEAMVADTPSGMRWRQVNHHVKDQDLPVRYVALATENPDWRLAIGRDLRSAASLQQRLLQTQQAMERDYIRLRQAESRYRLLFNQAAEAIIIVDATSRRLTEANPAAALAVGVGVDAMIGRPVISLFHADDRDRVVSLLGAVSAAEMIEPIELRLAQDARDCRVTATLFRQGRGSYFLIRLIPGDPQLPAHVHPDRRLIEILEKIPDAFVVTDIDLAILAENTAFLEMTQFARKEQVRGEPLARFLGRPGIDLNLLLGQLRDHGVVSNFATIMRDQYDSQDDVEVSAVLVNDGMQECIGFTIRMIGRLREPSPAVEGVTRSVEQLTELVGRVSLKEIVRESTDLIERLCIEAALAYTSDNRASAAEILGLSRQSLYSKLHRHGLAVGGNDSDNDA